MKNGVLGGVAALLLIGQSALAIDNFNLSTLTGLSQDQIKSVLRPVALGMDHRAYQSASPLGLTGFDIGAGLTIVSLPDDFVTAFNLMSGATGTTVPSSVPLPKFSIHKGLPGNFGIGFSYVTSSMLGQGELFNSFGWELQWTPISGAALPAVAARLSGSYSKLWFISSSTHTLDAVVSKSLVVIDPYAGAGFKLWSATMDVPLAVPVPVGITADGGGLGPHIFAGLSFKMLILKVTGEYDYNLSGLSTYGVKASIGF